MKMNIFKKKKWLGYTFYGILLTVALLYLRFPSGALRDFFQETSDRIDTRLLLSIEKVSPSLLFGLTFNKTKLSMKEAPDKVLFKADRLTIRPRIWSFLKGDFQYYFECLAYGGDLTGRIHFTKNRLGGPFDTSIQLNDIHIADNSFIPRVIGHNVEGVLSGTIFYNGKDKSLRNGAGEADLIISDGWIKLLRPILSLESIDFNKALFKIVLKNQKLNLTHVELNSENLHGSASGTIFLRKEFLKSRLDLKGAIEPFADFFQNMTDSDDIMKIIKQRLKGGKLSFKIQGTIKDPKINFI
ncbi:MAG: type II secretion system protein GspN [Deltaproteobacteria bacterium]|nr:type II secretion system protein GspN [Deltaproteobacteria bacterium]